MGDGDENLVGESTGGIFSRVRTFSANGGLPQSSNMKWQSNILGKKCLHFLDEFTQEWSKECSFLIEVYPPFIIFGCCPYFLDKYLMLLSLVIHLFFCVFKWGTHLCLSVCWASYLRNHISCDQYLWYTCGKWWYLHGFLSFSRNFDFLGCLGG